MDRLDKTTDVFPTSTPPLVKSDLENACSEFLQAESFTLRSNGSIANICEQRRITGSPTTERIWWHRQVRESQRGEQNIYDPFTRMRDLNESRADYELEERNERRGRAVPKTTVVIRLPRLSTNQPVAEVPVVVQQRPTQLTIRSADNMSVPPIANEKIRAETVIPNTSFEKLIPTSSVESSVERSPVRKSSYLRVSSMKQPLQNVNSASQTPETGSSAIKDLPMEVISMSAEERILLMRNRRWSLDGGVKSAGGNSTTKSEEEGESRIVAGVDGPERGSMSRGSVENGLGENDVQQKVTIPFGVKRGTECGKWSLFKRKGWELIHKAESINYVRT